MGKTKSLEELKALREKLEKELQDALAQEKAMTDKKLREIAGQLIIEVKNLDYSAWAYEPEGDNGFKIKITTKPSGTLGKAGRRVIITNTAGEKREFNSCKKACEHFDLAVNGDSAKRILEKNNYKVEYVKTKTETAETETAETETAETETAETETETETAEIK